MTKRKSNVTNDALYSKRQRSSFVDEDGVGAEQSEQSRVNVTYGQRGAFPGLDEEDMGEFYGPANDGLEYLRMVR